MKLFTLFYFYVMGPQWVYQTTVCKSFIFNIKILYMYIYVTDVKAPIEAKRSFWGPWSWRCRQLWEVCFED